MPDPAPRSDRWTAAADSALLYSLIVDPGLVAIVRYFGRRRGWGYVIADARGEVRAARLGYDHRQAAQIAAEEYSRG